MKPQSYYLINAITMYRVMAAPALVAIAVTNQPDIFKWMLPISFFTDLIDGFLSRKFKIKSVFGSRLDSIGDDLTFVAAFIGALIFKLDFIVDNLVSISFVITLLLIQIGFALYKYGKITSFHTYFAKLATLLQGCFLIALFLLPEPLYLLFYLAIITTAIEIIEEILLTYYLPVWKVNVKGLYWILMKKKK